MKASRARLTLNALVNSYASLSFDESLSPQSSAALLDAARALGLRAELVTNERFARTDVLLAASEGHALAALTARYPQARVYDPPIIALAIEPQAHDALPALQACLSGDGAPAGVRRADVREGAVILEFSPEVTQWKLLRELIDLEVQRFGGGRRITTLSPLTIDMQAQLASDGLECRELDSTRILETLVERAGP